VGDEKEMKRFRSNLFRTVFKHFFLSCPGCINNSFGWSIIENFFIVLFVLERSDVRTQFLE
jgi:hypothetical protein